MLFQTTRLLIYLDKACKVSLSVGDRIIILGWRSQPRSSEPIVLCPPNSSKWIQKLFAHRDPICCPSKPGADFAADLVLYEMRREDVACPVCTSAWWGMDLFDLLNGVYDEQRGFAKKRLCLKKCVGDDWPVQIGDFLGVHRSSLVVTLWCQNVDGTKVWQLLSLHQNLSIGHYCCYLEWKTGASLYGQLYFGTIPGTNSKTTIFKNIDFLATIMLLPENPH